MVALVRLSLVLLVVSLQLAWDIPRLQLTQPNRFPRQTAATVEEAAVALLVSDPDPGSRCSDWNLLPTHSADSFRVLGLASQCSPPTPARSFQLVGPARASPLH